MIFPSSSHLLSLSPKSVIITLFLALLLMPGSSHAQDEGKPLLQNEAVGRYLLSVWVSPEPATVGRLHFTARLQDGESGRISTAPAVTLTARAPHTDVFTQTMTLQGDSYAAELELPYAAIWEIEISIDDGAEQVRTSFPLDVQPAPINNNLIRLAAFATLVVLATGWWFWGRHPRKKRVRKRIFMPRPPEDN